MGAALKGNDSGIEPLVTERAAGPTGPDTFWGAQMAAEEGGVHLQNHLGRIEVPVWPDVQQAVLVTTKAMSHPGSPMMTSSSPPVGNNILRAMPVPATQEKSGELPIDAADPERDEEEVEDDTYVPPEGQGCFSFRQSLLLRAKDTYSARSNGNKYEIISKWPLTGLAVVLSRPNWHIRAKRGTLTSTPRELLRLYYQQGHPADLVDKARLPYALPWRNAITTAEWQHIVTWFSHARYLQDMDAVNAERSRSTIDIFYATMNQTNPIKAAHEETEQATEQASSRKQRLQGFRKMHCIATP